MRIIKIWVGTPKMIFAFLPMDLESHKDRDHIFQLPL